jgi:excinuclease UvrABC nuclease subunit
MSIVFTNGIEKWTFTDPSLSFPSIPIAGIYAVLTRDTNWKPLPYRVLYFGKAGDLRGRVCGSHEKFWSWRMEAGGTSLLFYSFRAVATEAERTRIETELIRHYGPPCNDKDNLYKTLFGL